MPGLIVVSAAGNSQRRLVIETLKKLEDRGYRNMARTSGGEWSDLFSKGMTGGLFEDRTCSLVETASQLGRFPEKMANFIETPDAASLIVLVYSGDHAKYLSRDVLKKVELIKAEEVPFWPSRRIPWLIGVSKKKGAILDKEAAALLVDWIDDPEELRSELDKLAGVAENGRINVALVRALSLDEGKKSLLRLLDGLCRGNPEDVIVALAFLREKGEIIPTIASLHKRMRLVMYAQSFPEEPRLDILSVLGASKHQRSMAAEAVRRCSPELARELVIGLIRLSCLERLRGSEGWNGLENLLLKVMDRMKGI